MVEVYESPVAGTGSQNDHRCARSSHVQKLLPAACREIEKIQSDRAKDLNPVSEIRWHLVDRRAVCNYLIEAVEIGSNNCERGIGRDF